MKSQRIVIIGCGRLGSHLANLLSSEGHRVVVVDRDAAAFGKLASEAFSGSRIEGDACEPAVLVRAGADRADLVIAATHDDNVNLMAAQVARDWFGVERVMARVYDPAREQSYRALGLTTVCPTRIAGAAFLDLVRGADAADAADAEAR